jgi:hypothetical protein
MIETGDRKEKSTSGGLRNGNEEVKRKEERDSTKWGTRGVGGSKDNYIWRKKVQGSKDKDKDGTGRVTKKGGRKEKMK